MRGLPSGVNSRRCASSGSPVIQVAKPGEAMRLLICIASLRRSFAGKNVSRSNAPSLSNAGFCTAWMRPVMSSDRPCAPGAFENVGEQDVFARADRIGVDAEQTQQARDHRADAIAQRARVGQQLGGGRRERTQHRQRQAGLGARRVDGHVGGGAQPARCARAPGPTRPGPSSRLSAVCAANSRHAQALARGLARVHPRLEIRRREIRETSASGCRGRPSDRCRWPARRRWRLLRAARGTGRSCREPVMPTHTACVVRSLRVVEDEVVLERAGGRVELAAQVEDA